ncbi:GrdX family protein [Gemelliphila palaticanis]|uniref:GrdX family protein n=1 Tax=Gemelliphila palaticanis TaxID=81950 RepID=A0ABX2T1F4_9BACL|nr:GrdX family protein [Gemella palaticanis]MBF0715542.1 GrdX family protein [Gemella palaticanis]NYS47472.1 GrdX family protein [Gemella palaticanis]
MILITNNPKFRNYDHNKIKVEFYDGNYKEVLNITRDYIHNNYILLTHPLYGSVKPNETIYRSVLIKDNVKLDYDSVNIISDAISTFDKFQKNKITPNWTDRIRDDFSVIDYDLITNAINRIL